MNVLRKMKSKTLRVLGLSALGAAIPLTAMAGNSTQFMTTVQIAVKEPTPALKVRSQKLVLEEFDHAIRNWPELSGRPYDIRKHGDQVVVTLLSEQDLKDPMQSAVSDWLQHINGKARVLGRTRFYRQASSRGMKGFLKVVVTNGHDQGEWIQPELDEEVPPPPHPGTLAALPAAKRPGIVSISAGSVPLRNLLNVLERKIGDISYLIHEECLNRRVTWNFGESGNEPPRDVDTVMAQLATFLGLKHEPSYGTHVFQGTCEPVETDYDDLDPGIPVPPPEPAWVSEVSLASGGPSVRHIQPRLVIPLMPLSY